MNAPRHAPAAPSRPARSSDDAASSLSLISPSGTVPPWSAHSSRPRSSHGPTGWSADSKPRTSSPPPSATSPTPADDQRLAGVEQAAVRREQRRLRQGPHRRGAVGEAGEAHAGRAPSTGAGPARRIHASVMMPRDPSEPRNRRSGLGPGAAAGQPARLADARSGSRPASTPPGRRCACRRWRSGRRSGWPASRRGSSTSKLCGKWRRVRPCGRSWSSSTGPRAPAWMRAARLVRSISSTRSRAVRSIDTTPAKRVGEPDRARRRPPPTSRRRRGWRRGRPSRTSRGRRRPRPPWSGGRRGRAGAGTRTGSRGRRRGSCGRRRAAPARRGRRGRAAPGPPAPRCAAAAARRRSSRRRRRGHDLAPEPARHRRGQRRDLLVGHRRVLVPPPPPRPSALPHPAEPRSANAVLDTRSAGRLSRRWRAWP